MLGFTGAHEPNHFDFVPGAESAIGHDTMDQSKATERAWNWLTQSRNINRGHVKAAGEWLELAREMAGFAMGRFQAQITGIEFWKRSEHKVGWGPLDSCKLVRQMEVGQPENLTECLVMPASVTEEQEVEYIVLAWKPWKPTAAEIKRIRKEDGRMEKDFRMLVGSVRNDSKAQEPGSCVLSKATEA